MPMNSETLKVLEKARALIADEAHWCRGAFAVDEHGNKVGALEAAACAWCASGATIRASNASEAGHRARVQLAMQIGSPSVANFNDIHSHAEVLALFDRVIARLREEAP